MPELPLTDTEKKQILNYMGWSIATLPQDYPYVYVMPVLDSLTNEAALGIVRGHLARLEAIYTKLESEINNFSLSEVAGIKFDGHAEKRLWAQFCDWLRILCACLNVEPNPQLYGTQSKRRRII